MKPTNQTILRLALLCWMVAFHLPGSSGVISRTASSANNFLALHAGCITSSNQLVHYEGLPNPINATVATGGSCGSAYLYQWQWSRDQAFWTDIPGATSQNLSFSNPITNYGFGVSVPETVYFQRRATCGPEIQYTTSVSVTRALVYYNTANGNYFYNENCPSGTTPEAYWVTIPANQFTSLISVADANNIAWAWAQGQANQNGQCFTNVYLYYTNNSGCDPLYVTMTNTVTNQQYYFEMMAFNSGGLGEVPEGTYNIEFFDYCGWVYRSYSVGCSGYTSGYPPSYIYNVSINSGCNSFSVWGN